MIKMALLRMFGEVTPPEEWKEIIVAIGGPASGVIIAVTFGWWLIQKVIPKLDQMLEAIRNGKDETIIAMNRVTEVLSTLIVMNELTPQSTKDRIQKTMQEAKDDSVTRRG